MAAFLFKIEITDKKLFFNIVFVFSVLLPKFPSYPAHLSLNLHHHEIPNKRYDDETYKRNFI